MANPNKTAPARIASGVSTKTPEDRLSLPVGVAVSPESSWIDYRCWVEVELDPGMALHKPLPQNNPVPDTLALIDCQDQRLDTFTSILGGVNLQSNRDDSDTIQRMATSTYHFVLRGYAVRAGYQIPIPGLFRVGNQAPTPVFPQRGTNLLIGNFNGVPIWYAVWELHYAIAQMPTSQGQLPVPFNPALHIRPDAELPKNTPLPALIPDPDHLTQQPGGLAGGIALPNRGGG